MYEYTTAGTCSTKIHFNIRENKLYDLSFEGGCNGNLKAIGKLVEGMDAGELVTRLKGIECGSRPTSCGDQLATAVSKALQLQEKQA